MSKGPLPSREKDSIEYWAKHLFGKKYEYLTDIEAEAVWVALEEFLLNWQEGLDKGLEDG